MNPSEAVEGRLLDIYRACGMAMEFVKGNRFYDYERSALLQSGVERQLEIAGEAARKIPQSYKEKASQVNWKLMIGIRKIIAHEYGEIRHEVIWSIVKHKLPEIVKRVDELLKKE